MRDEAMTARIDRIGMDAVQWTGDLVHPTIARDTPAYTAHRWLIGTRIGVAMIGLFQIFLYLAMPTLVPAAVAMIGMICFFQLVIAVGVSKLGGFRAGLMLSQLSLAFIPVLAGGPSSLALLMPLVIESALLQGQAGALRSGGLFVLAAFLSFLTAPSVPPSAMVAFALIGGAGVVGGAMAALHLLLGADFRATREEDRWRGAAALVDGGLARHDASGKIIGANHTFCRFLGIDADRLGETSVIERLHLASAPLFLKALSDASHGAKAVETQIRIRAEADAEGHDPADPYRDAVVRFQRVAPRSVAGVAHGEGEILALYRPAPQPVAKRKNETAETLALQQAQLGHELRTPLTAIVGFADCLSDPTLVAVDDPRHADYARMIGVSARHMLDLVDDLVQGTRTKDTMDRIDLAALLEETIAMVKADADAKGARITAHLAPHLPRIVGNRRGVRQIAINLLSNAIKFSPESDIRVTLHQNGPTLALMIADDGIGVDAEDLPRLTEARYRGRAGRAADAQGQGLGLAIVRDLVRHHDGTLEIESRPGEGTRVTVCFPLEEAQALPFHDRRRVAVGGRRHA